MAFTKIQPTKRPKLLVKGLERKKDVKSRRELAENYSKRLNVFNLRKESLDKAHNFPFAFANEIRPKAKAYGVLLRPVIRELAAKTDMVKFISGLGENVVEFLDSLGPEYRNVIFGFPVKIKSRVTNSANASFEAQLSGVGFNLLPFFIGLKRNKIAFVKYLKSMDPLEFGRYIQTVNETFYFQIIKDFVEGLGIKNIQLFISTLGPEKLRLFHRGLGEFASRKLAAELKRFDVPDFIILQFTGFNPKDLKIADFQ